jgi:rhamnosyltransferase
LIQASILIPTKNGQKDFKECLEAIYRQKDVGPLEVIVVDSGSTDSTLDIAGCYPVRLERISPAAFHHARTRNFAASLAKGKFLVFLSQDAVPFSNTWLARLLNTFVDPNVGAAYGRQLAKEGAPAERQQVFGVLYGATRLVKRPGEESNLGYKHYHFSSVNAAIRRDVWEQTRFPEDFKVFEDIGIAKRILDAGWSIVYEPQAAVYHSHEFSNRALFRRYFDIGVVYQRLGIWSSSSRRSLRHDGWQILRRKFKRMLHRNGTEAQGTTEILTSVGKFIAIELGRRERFLPLGIKRRLSEHQLFDNQ